MGLTLTSIDDGRVRRVNEFACQLLGRDAREVVGRNWHELVDPMQVEELRAIDPGDVLAGRLDWRQRTVRFVRPDGQITHVLAFGSKVTIDGDRCFLSQIQDITELVSTHRQLQLVLDNTPVSVFLLDHDGRVLTSGGAAHQLPAARLRQVTGSSVFTAFRDHPAVLAMVRRSLRGERVHEVLAAGGHWYDVHLVPLPGAAAQRPSVAGVASDVTEHERASAELRVRTSRQTALADLAQQALEVADEDVLWDRGTRTLTEQISAEVMIVRGRPAPDRHPGAWAASDDSAGVGVGTDPSAPYSPTIPAHLNYDVGLQGQVLSDSGATMPATERSCTVMRVPVGPADEPVATICLRGAGRRRTSDDAAFIRSVSAILGSAVLRIRMEQDAQFRSLHDPLTGLPNRAALLDALRRSLSRTGRNQTRTGVLFVDLDGFKAVNDTLGHQAGDKLLTTVATRLRRAVRPGDVAGRLAGDEFAVLCEGVGSLDDLQSIGERVIQALEPTVELRRPVNVSASVGAALSGPGLTDAERLITAADVAMYEAKRQGGGCLVRYDEPVRAVHAARLRNVTALQHALCERRLVLRFLPIARQVGPIVAVEAIPCWPHPARRALAPEDIEPIAVDAGLSSDLDLWLVDSAIRYAHDAAGAQTPMTASTLTIRGDKQQDESRKTSPREMWIRLSARSFGDPALRKRIIARTTGSAPAAGHGLTLCIVIPDKLRAQDRREIDTAIDQLADAGVAVRLDFTETTPLRAMAAGQLPSGLHGVSLSEQYVHGVDHSDATAAVLAGVVCFAHLLHLDVAARGVNTPSELDAIRALDCDLAQGAAVGQALPMPPW